VNNRVGQLERVHLIHIKDTLSSQLGESIRQAKARSFES
jgi:hypothetical protein